jgi:hypothetical protein
VIRNAIDPVTYCNYYIIIYYATKKWMIGDVKDGGAGVASGGHRRDRMHG